MIGRLRQLVSRQLSHPAGAGGKLVARLMNRGNRKMNTRAIELLDVRPDARVLDLGFGGGLAIEMLLARGGHVTGVERATDMVAAARTRHAGEIAAERLSILEGDVAALPLPDASVDRVLTINTIYFWRDLPPALGEIRRVLAPDGVVVIGIRDGSEMKSVSREIFTVRPAAEIAQALGEAGFGDTRVESPSDHKVHYLVSRK